MTDKDAYGAPQIQDKRRVPLGLVPKNAQHLVIGGLAVVMVIIIAFSGSKPSTKAADQSETPVSDGPNDERIEQYKERIEEQARRLEQEKLELIRSQRGMDLVTTHDLQQRDLVEHQYPNTTPVAAESRGVSADQAKREYESLFASNVALSYREDNRQHQSADLSLEGLTKLLPVMAALSAMQQGSGSGTPTLQPTLRDDSAPASEQKHATPKPESMPQPGYPIFEGTLIETVLTNRLDGEFSGPVNCMVTTPVYSRDGQHVLIPSGSRALGEVRPINHFGQQRLAVVFHRLIMPDGYSVSLDKFQGLNQIGETGLRDKINHHYWQVFGVSLAIGAIAGLGHATSRTGSDLSALDAYEQGVTSSLSQSSLRILDRYLNVLPTHTIREGHRVKIHLAGDLMLPAYDQHSSAESRRFK